MDIVGISAKEQVSFQRSMLLTAVSQCSILPSLSPRKQFSESLLQSFILEILIFPRERKLIRPFLKMTKLNSISKQQQSY